jgi:alpha-L-fucosidase
MVMRSYLPFSISFTWIFLLLYPYQFQAQESYYQVPTDPLVQQKLENWQDLKFGFMMHWGTYSQWGIVESWALCSEDQPWCTEPRKGRNYVDFKQDYENLITTFNPTQFDPDRWAEAAAGAGMKYVVFTTKHHDGFSMFDTQQTDYKVTAEDCPFSKNPKANIAKEIFEAFRKKDFMTGAYFSKPDWHHPDYWAPEWSTPNRCNNYDIRRYPERWQRFKDFTYNQIEELMTDYGTIDILWLDGGWVRPDSTITEEVIAWGYDIPEWEQDIDMPRIAKMARQKQPGLIMVDRTVHGPYENYTTPEQRVPDKVIDHPWETCMTMGGGWSYSFKPNYKSTRTLIHTLVDIVAKGGNFLLNVGPSPDGTLDEEAYKRLEEIGAWMDINGEAIYSSRPIAPYKEGKIAFTQNRHTQDIYAIYLAEEKEVLPPEKIILQQIQPAIGSQLYLLGYEKPLKWAKNGTGCVIELPVNKLEGLKNLSAWTIKIEE